MPRINETFARRAPAPERGNKLYRDDDMTGFALRVTAAGARSFVLSYTIHKRERRLTIGAFPAWTAAAAREDARRLRRQIDQGIDPLEERNDSRDAPTLLDLWKEYQRIHLPTLSPRGAMDQASMWRTHILPKMKHVRLEDLSARQIDALHARVGMVGTTRANRVVEMLRKALNLAIRWGWIQQNPAQGFRRNPEHPRERYLRPEEYERVFRALDEMPNRKAADAIRLLILTGARRGEVLSLEWADLDLELGLWNRPAAKSKDRKRKRVTLSNEALVLLRRLQEDARHSYVFATAEGGPMPDLKRSWAWLKARTGLPDLRIHDLRHSFASVLVSGGETLETIGKLLGHSQHQTTLRYAHLMDDPMRRAANRFSERVRISGTQPIDDASISGSRG
jgi:integrase